MAHSEVYQIEPPQHALGSIDEDNSYHSRESLKDRRNSEVYPDDSASGFQHRYRSESEEKQMILDQSPMHQQSQAIPPPPPAANYMPHQHQPPVPKSMGIELDHDSSFPSLDTVRENRHITLYLFDNSEPHPRIRSIANEPNVAFIRTMSYNGIPYKDKHIMYNIQSFNEDINNLKLILESGHYLRLLIAHSGFGVGSGLSIKAPKTWAAFKYALNNFFNINSVHNKFEMRWNEWEMNARLHHEELSPEMQRMKDMMQYAIEKKKDEWKLRAHLGYKKQQHMISNARRRIDEKLKAQRRALRKERAKEQYLHDKHVEIRRHNELMKIQKDIERQHAQKNKELDLQMEILNDKMAMHRRQIRKTIALKDVSQRTESLMEDYTKNMTGNLNRINGKEDVYNVSKIEDLLPNMSELQNIGVSSGHEPELQQSDDEVVDFWDKMKKIDADMGDMQERLSVLKNL